MSTPEKLGKYQITAKLGEGAMGVVYKGFDPDIRRVVALKTIRRSLLEGEENSFIARFRNEAQAAGRLGHPGIVGVYDFGQDDDIAFIAMEYVEGRSLGDLLANKVRFTDSDIPGLMIQLLEALHHAHEQGVWHRDIKPANIILARDGRLKIADFGIARIEDAGLTQVHMIVGTPAYMAPEQFLGTDIDRRVDIYSAGVLLYILLVGHPPFRGPADSLMYKAVHEAPVLPSAIPQADRPMFYDALVARALAKTAADRFATAAEFRAALEAAVGAPIDPTGWDQTVVAAPQQIARPSAASGLGGGTAAAGASSASSASSNAAGTALAIAHWDPKVLSVAEASLARFVGPLARVLVRKVARDCQEVETLYARLAEQVNDPGARATFIGQATAAGLTSVARAPSTAAAPPAPAQATAPAASSQPLSERTLEEAKRLLAPHVGPIAGVLVKRSAARAPQREAFVAALLEAVSEPKAREQLRVALAGLP